MLEEKVNRADNGNFKDFSEEVNYIYQKRKRIFHQEYEKYEQLKYSNNEKIALLKIFIDECRRLTQDERKELITYTIYESPALIANLLYLAYLENFLADLEGETQTISKKLQANSYKYFTLKNGKFKVDIELIDFASQLYYIANKPGQAIITKIARLDFFDLTKSNIASMKKYINRKMIKEKDKEIINEINLILKNFRKDK
jgi:hypothetical protein